MPKPLQLCYPVRTLTGEELLPAGSYLTKSTMEELVRSAEQRTFPTTKLMEFGSIASDLQRICEHPPYCQMFSDPVRRKDVFTLMQRIELPQPLLEVYRYFRTEDAYTYWHILTVFALSLLLFQDLFDAQKRAEKAAAATSHDFGKMCVPLEVLQKETPLNAKEQQLLSQHAAAGYVVLSYYLRNPEHPAAITARDHHERCNGSGYPRGIKLTDQVVEVVAGGDIFDALISQRPYRPHSYELRTALEAMALQAGQGEIGSAIVHALIRNIRKDLPCQENDKFSLETRGTPPKGNRYRGVMQCRFDSDCETDGENNSDLDVE